MKCHYLKIDPEHLEQVMLGNKTAEVRFNDRDFQVGDLLFLRGYSDGEYTDNQAIMKITHIVDDDKYMQPRFVMLSMQKFV
ncbi:DUF3850 domain-containing protein [Gilliamella apicola]|uniref:DUF3850 domain-containing protein n=1 Tax=Gilliamella apicola TaxID=1196095 RepID=UPI00080ECD0D|nr:DUF3850 domain-containing protein [Gilliamella apicola]OCG09714.1 hypothetical protein A9G14_11985 [Gilliamella apicola]